MKYAKLIGLAATAIAALMMFAGNASADKATSPTGTTYTGTLNWETTGGHISFHGSNGVTWECSSKFSEHIVGHGEGVPVTTTITSWSFYNCTNSYVVHVQANGSASISATSGTNGTRSMSGSKWVVTASTIFGTITCEYTTSNTSIGTITGSGTTGANAILDLAATVPRTGGSSLCGSTGTWTGQYRLTSPSSFKIDKS